MGERCPPAAGAAPLEELRLDRDSAPLTSLGDLERLPNLKTLDLGGHPLAGAEFPATLGGLTALNLTGCGVERLAFLEGMPLQVNLALGDNQVVDLSPLAALDHLSYLDISGNQADDLTPLAGLSDLHTVLAEGNPVTDWVPVAHVDLRCGG